MTFADLLLMRQELLLTLFALIILVMEFMPGGLVGLKDRIFARRKQP